MGKADGAHPAEDQTSALPHPRLWAAIALGCVAVTLAAAWVVRSEVVFRTADLAAMSLPVAAFFPFLLAVAARWLGLILGRRRAQPTDWRALLVLYAMLASSVGLATLGAAQSLVIQLPAPFFRATPANRWAEIQPLIPSWAVPRSPMVLRGFYLGGSLWRADVLAAWLPALAFWTFFALALVAAMLSLAWFLRRRFIDEERLVFPLAVLPVELCRLPTQARRLRLAFAAGLALALAVQGMAALHHEFPAVPAVRVLPTDLAARFSTPALRAMGSFWVAFYPCAIGLAYLLPLDTALSCWAWHLLVKLEYVAAYSFGLRGLGWPLQGEQAQGAMAMLALLALSPRRRAGALLAGNSALPAFAASFAALAASGAALGLSLLHSAAFFALYFLGMVAVARLRAQVGPMWNPGTDVSWLLMAPTGPRAFASRELAALAMLRWFSYGDCRGHPLPTQLEALKIGQLAGIPSRSMLAALAVAGAVGAPAAILATLDTYYRWGAATAQVDQWRTSRGDIPWTLLVAWLANPQAPPRRALFAVAAGAAILWLHALAQSRLWWWLLTPAGFAMAVTGSLEWLWMPIFIAWLVKRSVLRWGGMQVYRATVPFFMGLVAGDYLLSGVLAVLSWLLRRSLYRPFPI